MKVVITGGAGFIGSYFAAEFLSRGCEVVSFDLAPPSRTIQGIVYVEGDIRDSDLLKRVLANAKHVLHLAAAHHDFGIQPETFESVNVDGARNVCNATKALEIDSVCFFSTVAVYGSCPTSDEVNSVPRPISPYGRTKLAAEYVFRDWANEVNSRRCVVIRPTVTFGPENYANMFTLIDQIYRGRFAQVGSGDNLKSLAFVENIVQATITAWLDTPQETSIETYNYVDKPDLSSRQISQSIYRALGKRPPSVKIPYWLAKCLILPFDAIIAITGFNLPISGNRLKKFTQSETQFDAKRIRELGFKQSVSIEQGIEKMVKWYLSEGRRQKSSEIRRVVPK